MASDLDREWSQEELRQHCIALGMKSDAFEGEVIPQGVKLVSKEPLTEADMAWARRVLAEHPEWEQRAKELKRG